MNFHKTEALSAIMIECLLIISMEWVHQVHKTIPRELLTTSTETPNINYI